MYVKKKNMTREGKIINKSMPYQIGILNGSSANSWHQASIFIFFLHGDIQLATFTMLSSWRRNKPVCWIGAEAVHFCRCTICRGRVGCRRNLEARRHLIQSTSVEDALVSIVSMELKMLGTFDAELARHMRDFTAFLYDCLLRALDGRAFDVLLTALWCSIWAKNTWLHVGILSIPSVLESNDVLLQTGISKPKKYVINVIQLRLITKSYLLLVIYFCCLVPEMRVCRRNRYALPVWPVIPRPGDTSVTDVACRAPHTI